MAVATPPILAVTTPELAGYRITRYLGIVAGEAIMGTDFGEDLMAGIKDFTGSRVTEWEPEIQRARYTPIVEMSQRAQAWGANAVVGVSLDHEVNGPDRFDHSRDRHGDRRRRRTRHGGQAPDLIKRRGHARPPCRLPS